MGPPIPERKIDQKKDYRRNSKVHRAIILPCFLLLGKGGRMEIGPSIVFVEEEFFAGQPDGDLLSGYGAYFLNKNGKMCLNYSRAVVRFFQVRRGRKHGS